MEYTKARASASRGSSPKKKARAARGWLKADGDTHVDVHRDGRRGRGGVKQTKTR